MLLGFPLPQVQFLILFCLAEKSELALSINRRLCAIFLKVWLVLALN